MRSDRSEVAVSPEYRRADREGKMDPAKIMLVVAGIFVAYALIRNTPDIIRYIRISRM